MKRTSKHPKKKLAGHGGAHQRHVVSSPPPIVRDARVGGVNTEYSLMDRRGVADDEEARKLGAKWMIRADYGSEGGMCNLN